MNVSESERLSSGLDQLGYEKVKDADDADIVILNSCVVRQGAEDKVTSRLDSLKGHKRKNPDATIALMGCMVGPRTEKLQERFPHVEYFMRPQEFQSILDFAAERQGLSCDSDLALLVPEAPKVSTFVPIMQGCDEFCTFCIVPYRRGREKSRDLLELVHECEKLVERGVLEVTLLGQIVDRYGMDLDAPTDLADLLKEVNDIPGIERIRFLTSHPRDMSQKIIDAVASLENVCENINIPFQSGNDDVLERMRRPYNMENYLKLIENIRGTVEGVSLSTDVIVGFCGETDREFEDTLEILKKVQFDVVHTSVYSNRPGTIASRKLEDDVPLETKILRKKKIEEVQEQISLKRNQEYLGRTVEILVEREIRGKWEGRTRTNKLVHFEDQKTNWLGKMVNIDIYDAGSWSLRGSLPGVMASTNDTKPDKSEISLTNITDIA